MTVNNSKYLVNLIKTSEIYDDDQISHALSILERFLTNTEVSGEEMAFLDSVIDSELSYLEDKAIESKDTELINTLTALRKERTDLKTVLLKLEE